ncbi:hypothetical protein [Streptomyces aureoverticillatus]|uniref:hypothetical protein n=1 Tax=Streptomyces aureoverticillatus TaxID=66871 RepID=UPI0013DD0D5D|nr:hypothetical protein [Streptomyces aureoverticillatus]QIB41949.1 hypothetical protein G3H79_01525 [Streptomyces aureoverticillatus]
MRRTVVLVIGALAAMTSLTAPAAAVTTAPAAVHAAANPLPPLAAAESLINEGVTVEGPLINNVGLPHLL